MPKVHDLQGNVVEEVQLPESLSAAFNEELIKKAFLAERSHGRQPYGADPLAGKRTSAHYHGYRRDRYAMMNKEMSRIPRIHGRVGPYHMRARFAPHAVKGRQAHPPKAEKVWAQKINKKEYLAALRSSLSRSIPTMVVFVDDLENLKKTKEVKTIFDKVVASDLQRAEKKKVRAGRGKMRGRRYNRKKGPLVIVSKECSLLKAARNLPGVDVTSATQVKITQLAPGGHAGRRVIMTKSAIGELNKHVS